ncbi:MAG: glycosyltransferase family 4 protein [Gammaproteobacteria bacterium]
MNSSPVYFVFPGNLDTPSGGYHYDRRLIGELRAAGLAVEAVPLPAGFPFPDQAARSLTRQVLATLPDQAVVIVDGLAFGALAAEAEAEARRLRFIALCHHPLALESGLDAVQQHTLRLSEQRALQCARAVLVTSAYTRQLLVSQFAVAAGQVVVAQPGTERVAFAPCDGDPLRLLTVASLIPRKGHDVLIDALATLSNLRWEARFIGSDAFDPHWAAGLKQQMNRQQLAGRIGFPGALQNLEQEYQSADLFVLPSRFEGYGMVFAEALAAGLPIIAAQAGAVPDVVPPTAGILVAPDDREALTTALHRLLTDHRQRQEFQLGAREAAAALPTWADSARHVAALIKEVELS